MRSYTSPMNQHTESVIHPSAFRPIVSARPHRRIERELPFLPEKPSVLRSIGAVAFWLAYLGGYLAAGYAALLAIEWAWFAIFG